VGKEEVNDMIALHVPDRVPIMVSWGFLPPYLNGMTAQEVMLLIRKIGMSSGR
jgi:hypothetical protein